MPEACRSTWKAPFRVVAPAWTTAQLRQHKHQNQWSFCEAFVFQSENNLINSNIRHRSSSTESLTPTGLELFMKFPAELGTSISTMSGTDTLDGSIPFTVVYPLFIFTALFRNEADADGSEEVLTTGWFPNKFFSMPVWKDSNKINVSIDL